MLRLIFDRITFALKYDLRIIGNRIEEIGTNAILVTRTSEATKGKHRNVTIRNNVIDEVEGNGLRLIHVDGVTIQSNRISKVNGKERFEFVENIER